MLQFWWPVSETMMILDNCITDLCAQNRAISKPYCSTMIHLSTDLVHFQYLSTKSFTQVAILECPRDHFGSNNLHMPSWLSGQIGDLYLGYIQCSLKWEVTSLCLAREDTILKCGWLCYLRPQVFISVRPKPSCTCHTTRSTHQTGNTVTAQTALPNKNKTNLEHRRSEHKTKNVMHKRCWKLCMMNARIYIAD